MTLMHRIEAGRTDFINEALRSDSSAADREIMTRWALYYGDVTALRLLRNHDGDWPQTRLDGALTGAAFHGHWRLVEYLLEAGANAKFAQPSTEETPLHAALCRPASLSTEHIVSLLLSYGADPNAATSPSAETDGFMRDARTRGETPLHRAAAFGSLAIIEVLKARGGDLTRPDAHGDTPLSWASWAVRDTPILRSLLYGAHRIHPDKQSMGNTLVGGPPELKD